uniref:Uncharacterized protein n=1 Tax=Rhizophora mucronata TaxID=61149 RepID=A0A2P2R3N8_RHIMU
MRSHFLLNSYFLQ